ncbi:MAG: hypothetical protein ACRDQ4_24000 [Pseudonocardiaceae bacterium]
MRGRPCPSQDFPHQLRQLLLGSTDRDDQAVGNRQAGMVEQRECGGFPTAASPVSGVGERDQD